MFHTEAESTLNNQRGNILVYPIASFTYFLYSFNLEIYLISNLFLNLIYLHQAQLNSPFHIINSSQTKVVVVSSFYSPYLELFPSISLKSLTYIFTLYVCVTGIPGLESTLGRTSRNYR